MLRIGLEVDRPERAILADVNGTDASQLQKREKRRDQGSAVLESPRFGMTVSQLSPVASMQALPLGIVRMIVHVSVSLLDKISILEIKLHNITDENKLANVRREHLTLIKEICTQGLDEWLSSELYKDLLAFNFTLWNIEDAIRMKEALQEFDDEFINLARSVYIVNDARAQIKRKINEETNSLLVEEKSYTNYDVDDGSITGSNSTHTNVVADPNMDTENVNL